MRLALSDFPYPAYHLIQFDKYLLGTLQFSSGCPYLCEFCDIPNLYSREALGGQQNASFYSARTLARRP
jgi:radical SAM superfamily enzyme YgiQ (UPF0313 family)